MLPVSADVHQVPPEQFPTRNPPFLPNVVVLPEAQSLLVHAASMVANEVGFLSTQTNARMFMFNLLSQNYWNNATYSDVVKLVCDLATLKARTGEAPSAGSALNDAVTEALALVCSSLIVDFPDLSVYLTTEQVAAAHNNNNTYHLLINDIDAMYAEDARNGRGVQVGRQAPPPMNMQMNSRRQAPLPTGRRASGGSAPPPPPSLRNRPYQGRIAIENAPPPSRYEAAQRARGTTQRQAEPVPENPKASFAISEPTSIIGEIENMNRDMHSIAYFGKAFSIPTSPLRRSLEEKTENEEARAESEVEVNNSLSVMSAGTSTSELFNIIRAKHISTSSGLSVHLNHGLVVVPIISSIDIGALFVQLAEARTFAGVAKILNDHLDNIVKTNDKQLLRAATCYVMQIDRVLTKITNDFLTNSFTTIPPSIDSFVEDAENLPDYLNKKYNGIFNNHYINYQKAVLDQLFQHTRATGDTITGMVEYDEGTYWDTMTLSYGVTYIDATAAELGYSVTNKARDIGESTTPLLARLIEATQKTYGKSVLVGSHVVLTSDGTAYSIYKKLEPEAGFTIKGE